tara:strand:- start:5425 stop:5889 length:465 start_codon:yes stop_codon:yes gene_type:complete
MNFFNLFLILIHPIYISTVELISDKDEGILKIKIFRDDLEDGLRIFHSNSISINTQNKLLNNHQLVEQYLKSKLKIIIDEDEIKFLDPRFNLYNDIVEINYRFDSKNSLKSIIILNKILLEVYNVQKNVVFIKNNGSNRFYTFSDKDFEKKFIY